MPILSSSPLFLHPQGALHPAHLTVFPLFPTRGFWRPTEIDLGGHHKHSPKRWWPCLGPSITSSGGWWSWDSECSSACTFCLLGLCCWLLRSHPPDPPSSDAKFAISRCQWCSGFLESGPLWVSSTHTSFLPSEGVGRPTGASSLYILAAAPDTTARARLLAATKKETGAWLHALPISSLGLRMDDEILWVSVGLRLGVTLYAIPTVANFVEPKWTT